MDINEIVKKLSQLSYFERRVVLAKKIKPKLSRFIYKYRPVVHDDEISINRLKDILLRSKLWMSSPAAFNDPFDMSAKFIISTDASKKRKRFYNVAKENGANHKESEKFAREMMLKSHEQLESDFNSKFIKHIKQIGVYSFAGDPRNILMWSHYAKDHSGICIQFEVSRDITALGQAQLVEYTLDYPIVDWVNNFEDSLVDVMLRKHEGWKYEKEERIVLPSQANSYQLFKPAAIAGIIFGCKSSAIEEGVILDILEERKKSGAPPVKLYKSVQHNSQYKLKTYSHI